MNHSEEPVVNIEKKVAPISKEPARYEEDRGYSNQYYENNNGYQHKHDEYAPRQHYESKNQYPRYGYDSGPQQTKQKYAPKQQKVVDEVKYVYKKKE